MKTTRRILLASVVGASLGAALDARADATAALQFLWDNVLNDDAKSAISDGVSAALGALGRKLKRLADGVASGPGGGDPTIVVTARSDAGHLVLDAHVRHAGGRDTLHHGTAPHPRHADARAHFATIARTAHAWLSARNL